MKNRIFLLLSSASFFLLSFTLAFHFNIKWLPLGCLLLGFLVRVIFTSGYMEIFSFLIPVLPAFAVLESNGFPLNYLLLPLFFLCGIMAGEFLAGKGKTIRLLPELPRFYLAFLLLLGISFVFVMVRWFNLTLSPLALFKDTPVAPTGQRLSFGIIFPIVELALFSLSPLYYLLLKRSSGRLSILIAFLCGQSLSICYSLFQRRQVLDFPDMFFNGLASDPTAFGFLSALIVLLAWYLYYHFGRKWLGLLFAAVSLVGILNSATRIGLLTVFVVGVFCVFFGRKRILSVFALGILLAGSLVFYTRFFYQPGTNFLTRLKGDIISIKRSVQLRTAEDVPLLDEMDPRNVLWHYSRAFLGQFPVAGVGTGNFVFWVMSAKKGSFFHHLPANQYFFIASSTGLTGLSAFLLFCFALFRFKNWPEKWLLGTFLFLLIFNDYLWFSEIFLIFWLFASLGEGGEEKPWASSKRTRVFYIGGFLIFIVFNLLKFSELHPKNWARDTSSPYDYGLSYREKEGGRVFRWSGEKAGIYIFLDKDRPRAQFVLTCGAPLSCLPGRQQQVDVYWRGRHYRRVVFRENAEHLLQVEDPGHAEGFLEFRVRPAFNLKRMGLGAESRDLGVQVSGPGI